jgi:hypothetical protein
MTDAMLAYRKLLGISGLPALLAATCLSRDIEGKHTCRELGLDAVCPRLIERDNECGPFVFNRVEERGKPGRNRHTIRYGAEAKLAISEDWLRVGEKDCDFSYWCFI